MLSGSQARILITTTLTASGNYPITVTVSGGGVRDLFTNNNIAVASVTVHPLPDPNLDLQFAGLEVTQAIQNLANEINLVATKPTLARVFAQSNGITVTRVTARLHGRDASTGEELPGSPLSPINDNPCVTVDGNFPDRNLGRESFNFELLDGWKEGEVVLTAEINPLGAIPEIDFSNNAAMGNIEYEVLPPICLETYRVHTEGWIRPSGGGLVFADLIPEQTYLADNPVFINRALSLLPSPEIWLYQNSDILEKWGFLPYELNDDEENSWRILNTLWWRAALSWTPEECDAVDAQTDYLGMVLPDLSTSFAGIADGLTELVVKFFPRNIGRSYNSPWGGRILAHELGHNYGRPHVDCGDIPWWQPEDDSYPYGCDLADDSPTGFYGSDLSNNLNDLTFVAPTEAGDLMSYAGNRWISDYNWSKIRACLVGDFWECGSDRPPPAQKDSEQGSSSSYQSVTNGVTGDILLITGLLSETVNIAEALRISETIVPTKTIEKAGAPASGYSAAGNDYELLLLDSIGNVLYTQPYSITYLSDGDEPFYMFNIIAPFVQDTAEIQVISGTHSASRTVSQNAPTVSVLSPNGGEAVDEILVVSWEGDDVDGDDLFYSVQYSADHGQSWKLLASHIPSDSVQVDSSLLPGSLNESLIRVIANDGVNTTYDESDAPFSVALRSPVPSISNPRNGDVFADGRPITIRGSGFDPEDGQIPEDKLTWSLDSQGQVGTGKEITLFDLETGLYELTLTVTDSHGQQSSKTIEFRVGEFYQVFLPEILG
jgi:hypothetical protein